MKNNKRSFKSILSSLKKTGLLLNETTGGHYIPDHDINLTVKGWDQKIELNRKNKANVHILDPKIFLASLRETENSHKLKLFVNS